MFNKNNTVLRDFLNVAPMTINRAMAICKVDRTTFKRWLLGQTKPPAATMELLRLHAYGEPPSLHGEWSGWTFTQGKLWTPANRGYSPGEIEMFPMLYSCMTELHEIKKSYTLQHKLF
jgi:hypothetical protein